MQASLILDFDSTFVGVEALDKLAGIVLRKAPDRVRRVADIARITEDGMEGRIGFGESLTKRLGLFSPTAEDVSILIALLKKRVSLSIARNRDFLIEQSDNIYIVSGGFREFVVPVVTEFGIVPDRVYANTFKRNDKGVVIGCDRENPLSRDDGKIEQIKKLGLERPIIMAGDGYSDYRTREAGAVDLFIAYCENVQRQNVIERADFVADSFKPVMDICYSVKASTARV